MGLVSSDFTPPIVEIAFATDPMAVTPTWVDVSAYVRQVGIRRGRSHELGRVEAGTATVRLSNRDRRFDPSYAAGPYYPNVVPMRKLRIRTATSIYLFTGYIERWPQNWKGTNDAEVVITAVDGFEPLNHVVLSDTYPQQGSDNRVTQVLDNAGWPAGERTISNGQSDVQAITLAESSALAHITDVAHAEQGNFFFNGQGMAVFHDRHARLTAPYTTSQGTFGDGAGEIPYTDFVVTYDKDEIRNNIRVTRPGGVLQEKSDATSITKYFKRTYVLTPLITTDTEANALAEYVLSRFKDPFLRVTEVGLSARMSSTVYTHIITRELGDRITVNRRPPGGGATISQASHIEAIQHDIKNGSGGWQWNCKWSLSPVAASSYWSLGTSVLGTDTRLAY